MKATDYNFVKNININNNKDLFFSYIKHHKLKNTKIPDRVVSFIISKSFLLNDAVIHCEILDIINNIVFYNIYPGLFTYYANNYNETYEQCVIKLLKNLETLPKDLQERVYNFYKQKKYFNKTIFVLLSEKMDDKYKEFFNSFLIDKCEVYNIKYITNEMELLLNDYNNEKQQNTMKIGDLFNQTFGSNTKKENIKELPSRCADKIIKYVISNVDTVLNKNQRLPFLKFCYKKSIKISDELIKNVFDGSFDIISILSSEIKFIDYYIDCIEKMIGKNGLLNFDASQLLLVYLTKYDINIKDTRLYQNKAFSNHLNTSLEFCYDFLISNLQSFNDSNNLVLLNIFYNLLQIKHSNKSKIIINNIIQTIHTQATADSIAKYLYFIQKIIYLNVLCRPELKYIYKQLVYFDNDDIRVRCFIYKILGSIISDYQNLDLKIIKMLSDEQDTKAIITAYGDRFSQADIKKYNKNNVNVLAALIWFDFSNLENPILFPYQCELLTTIIQNTGNFYERRINRSGFLVDLIAKHRILITNDEKYDFWPFDNLLRCIKRKFTLTKENEILIDCAIEKNNMYLKV